MSAEPLFDYATRRWTGPAPGGFDVFAPADAYFKHVGVWDSSVDPYILEIGGWARGIWQASAVPMTGTLTSEDGRRRVANLPDLGGGSPAGCVTRRRLPRRSAPRPGP